MNVAARTPLNAIIGYTALENGKNAGLEEKTEYLRKIENAGHQLPDIVNDVLDMSRIESGKMELEPARSNLEDCIREAGDLVRTQLESKNIEFTVSCELQHKWVLCDRNLLNRVLMNLLCNAGKFTPDGGTVSLGIREISDTDADADYRISVRDSGRGKKTGARGLLEKTFSASLFSFSNTLILPSSAVRHSFISTTSSINERRGNESLITNLPG